MKHPSTFVLYSVEWGNKIIG